MDDLQRVERDTAAQVDVAEERAVQKDDATPRIKTGHRVLHGAGIQGHARGIGRGDCDVASAGDVVHLAGDRRNPHGRAVRGPQGHPLFPQRNQEVITAEPRARVLEPRIVARTDRHPERRGQLEGVRLEDGRAAVLEDVAELRVHDALGHGLARKLEVSCERLVDLSLGVELLEEPDQDLGVRRLLVPLVAGVLTGVLFGRI